MKYYFTFGFGQPHEGCYHVIDAPDYESARDLMYERFGRKWCAQYDEEDWKVDDHTQAEEYNLKEI